MSIRYCFAALAVEVSGHEKLVARDVRYWHLADTPSHGSKSAIGDRADIALICGYVR
jgi:hypothetical protein